MQSSFIDTSLKCLADMEASVLKCIVHLCTAGNVIPDTCEQNSCKSGGLWWYCVCKCLHVLSQITIRKKADSVEKINH